MFTHVLSSSTDVSTSNKELVEITFSHKRSASDTSDKPSKAVILKGKVVSGKSGNTELMVIADAVSIERKLAIRQLNEATCDSTTGNSLNRLFSF